MQTLGLLIGVFAIATIILIVRQHAKKIETYNKKYPKTDE